MYNTLFGANNAVLICLSLVDLDYKKIPRFRDAILRKDGNKYVVEILTRTGGNNRIYTDLSYLKCNLNYLNDYDDEYDSTYAHFIFSVCSNEDLLEELLSAQSRKSLNLREMFEKEFEEMKVPGTEAHERAAALAKGLEKVIESDETVFHIDELIELGKNDKSSEENS